jgi:hypothetical protein
MATARQFARMAAVRSALGLLRQRQCTTGCSLVVLGGACAPSTGIDISVCNNIDNESSDYDDFNSPHFPPLTSTSCAPLGRHLVVPGGATLSPPCTNIYFTLYLKDRVLPRRIFHPRSTCIDPLALVVPGRFWLWHRTGIG